jgi:hypothetical protein
VVYYHDPSRYIQTKLPNGMGGVRGVVVVNFNMGIRGGCKLDGTMFALPLAMVDILRCLLMMFLESGEYLHVSYHCVLQVPYVGLNFAVYESLKDWILKHPQWQPDDGADLHVLTKLACGAAAGTVGQTVAYPLDVIRRRLQMVGWKSASPIVTADGQVRQPMQYTGMLDAFRKTVKYEGFGALYKGLVPNSVKVAYLYPCTVLPFTEFMLLTLLN